ncbi:MULTISPECIES: bacterioferritin [Pseudoalteromonas]|uniref:Bacterioferritin n=1 Tax=Pseudoalteromonas ruthenica TaxID=151081 RepID=A0A0F4Q3L2_9GAMM|nr:MULTISPECIES: bacterioferritin [Pseudoalteromonas]KJY98181.1 bacterioferritin [Pseudoalteromonas ruthenica]KJZ02248.1 bacterioferritin [Pseudoalteromonas ruthenica]MCF2861109.1 bacterioferritin [Pseudoalteromonas sp. CNAT2-18]MCG7545022.1 bacterioferritin [Pseudoalteromonas sp. MM17-2]MCG7556978.1 bacterioferritin [Pseudoalteromonas sp. CNAT2-18.1]|tara:strand:- start:35503 stop:35985 length:483 start_codon:yes stop_codon:yes gene_type:complete
MQGKQRVIDAFNKLLANELAAIDQYFIHSRMYEDWGLNKLYERLEHERDEETQHADWLIKRILFLEGVPDLTKRRALLVGGNVKEMMANDLKLELEVVQCVKETIKICEEEQDYQSREVLEKLLFDTEEDHVYWLEQQLGLIEKIGIQNYQQSQMGESEA